MSKKPASKKSQKASVSAADPALRSSAVQAPVASDLEQRKGSFSDCILLFIVSLGFFLFNIQHPKTRNFDEFHYIPSAEQWIRFAENQNWEHPPLAKILISFGLRLFGDEPLGWRFMSVMFGALTLIAMYRIAYHLFGKSRQAGWICAALTFFNQLLYVQARIAMLDTFMMAFLACSLWHFVKAIQSDTFDLKWTRRAGIFMGLAIACKWFALVPWVMCGALLLLQAIRLKSPNRALDLIFSWILLPAVVYYATFLPYLFVNREPAYTLIELLTDFQTKMLEGQKRVVNSHPYNSQFWDWIWMKRPIWYAFDKEGENNSIVRGVLLLGNPFLMWGGLLAIVGLVVAFFSERAREWKERAFLISYFWFGFAFCWIAIPRKIAFYYYYYPAGMILSLAFTYWVIRSRKEWIGYVTVGIAFGFFWYFFPILSALPIPATSFMKWMWSLNWI